jgi:hypothetical protein
MKGSYGHREASADSRCSNVHPARAVALGVQTGDLKKAVRHTVTIGEARPSTEIPKVVVHQNVVPLH